MKMQVARSGRTLAETLRARGVFPELVCGGRGVCGRCLVNVTQGVWSCDGEQITAPARLRACRTTLISECGEVELPEADDAGITTDFRSLRPLPFCAAPVIGIDLGSTTLAALRCERGSITHRIGAINRQRALGSDVMSRIAAAAAPAKRRELQKLAADSINELLDAMPPASRLAFSGNTVMMLLLHGLDPSPLGSAPYRSPQLDFAPRPAAELGLHSAGQAFFLPCLGGFLGGDLTAALDEADPAPGEMVIDLGTNCEILFRPETEPDRIYGCSAAAGPAFEGGGIATGRTAGRNAVCHFAADGSPQTGGGEAQGICGSGLVELLARWLKNGVMDGNGHFTQRNEKQRSYAPGLMLTEADIAAFLQAKAAVGAGIAALSAHLHAPVRALKLAGGLADALDSGAARTIGLLPDLPVTAVGNTSLAGAVRLALAPERLAALTARRGEVTELSLAALPEFSSLYADHLTFGTFPATR